MLDQAIQQPYERFLDIFTQEFQAYQAVFSLEKEKKQLISENTMVDLEPLSERLEEQLKTAFLLEQKREQAAKPLYNHFNLDSEAPLVDFLAVLPDPERETLSSLYNEFKILILDLKELNELNNRILQDNIKLLNYMVNMLTGEMEYDLDYSDLVKKKQRNEKSFRINTMV